MPVHISLTQKLVIARKLEELCSKTSEGFCRWKPGWDDQKVAEAVGSPVRWTHVRNIRREIYGNDERRTAGARTSDITDRLTQIEDYLTRQNPNWKDAK